MDAHDLAGLNTLDDLRRLFTALGYEPAHDRTRPDVVARWRAFRILGILADDPRGAARTLARQCATAAEPALVAALGSRQLVVTAPMLGHVGSARSLSIGLEAPDPVAVEILGDLRPSAATTLQHALRVRDLLATERAGERFFRALQGMHRRMTSSLGESGSAADRDTAALLALMRVLFLYFVQAKGWLASRPQFLRENLDRALSRRVHFHRDILHPLFFGVLNRPAHQRSSRAQAFAGVPYLNGGLFEPHAVERRLGPVVFDNVLWRDAFDGCFERFRFTVREADEVNAIAPDMLGRVFENLMAADERAGTGTFYTPEPLVREIIERAIRVIEHRPIEAVTVLDPAAGSGAFLLGALDVIAAARIRAGDLTPPHTLRRDILRRQLFGVDRNPLAVRLAELRLWLAVIAHDPAPGPAQVEPLPNLDGVVRQGDALLDPLGAARALGITSPTVVPAARRVAEARRALFDARGPSRRDAVRALRHEEHTLAEDLLESGAASCRAALKDLAAAARSRDLFGKRAGLSEPQQRRRRQLKGQLQYLRNARKAVRDGVMPFFAFEVHCAEVAPRGFDLVVGNPPWVRAERLAPTLRRALKDRFTTWRARGGRGFGHDPDLAVAFVERALELTAPGGAVGLLVPSKVATAGYGTAVRALLARHTTLHVLHRVDGGDRAFRAAVYPLAMVARNATAEPTHRVALSLTAEPELAQRRLDGGPWVLIGDRAHDAVRRLLDRGEPLGTRVRPSLGLKTGADSVFVGRAGPGRGEHVVVTLDGTEVLLEPDLLRPALRGRDVGTFTATSRRVLLFAYRDGTPLRSLPPAANRWFAAKARQLEARSDYRGGPLWTVFRTEPATAPWRVVWCDLARRPQAVLLEAAHLARAIPLNTCYVAAVPDRGTGLLVAALLNSTWAAAYVRVAADEARGGYRRVNARVASRLPLPPSGPATDALVQLSAEAHAGHAIDGAALDETLADAWGLAKPDRHILTDLAEHSG